MKFTKLLLTLIFTFLFIIQAIPAQAFFEEWEATQDKAAVHDFYNAGAGEAKYVDLYHGTSKDIANAIRDGGIDLSKSRSNLDFGKGFYTTRNEAQALKWAGKKPDGGDVLKFRVPVSEMDNLKGLAFDNPSASWGRFIRHNRLGGKMHSYEDMIHFGGLKNEKKISNLGHFQKSKYLLDRYNSLSFSF